jgi:hypothetical protein
LLFLGLAGEGKQVFKRQDGVLGRYIQALANMYKFCMAIEIGQIKVRLFVVPGLTGRPKWIPLGNPVVIPRWPSGGNRILSIARPPCTWGMGRVRGGFILRPRKASGDAGSVEQHSLTDQIAADKYLQSKQAVATKGLGIKLLKICPGGTT